MERKISAKGSLTIPKNMRMELGIGAKEKIELNVEAGGDIVIRRVVGSCLFCGSSQELIKYEGRFVCRECLARMALREAVTK